MVAVDFHFLAGLNIELYVQVIIEKALFKYEKMLCAWVGPVPVIYKPYIDFKVGIDTQPIGISVGARYNYGFGAKYYFEYDSNWKSKKPIQGMTRTDYSETNGLTLSMELKHKGPSACPLEMGLIVKAWPDIGVFLYWMIKMAIQPQLQVRHLV